MDRIYWMIFKDSEGLIEDIREAKYCYFFRKDGALTSDMQRRIRACVMENGSFSFELKKGE